MVKEMDCFNYYPGDISFLDADALSIMLKRDGRNPFLHNGIWLGGAGDNQRRTEFYYIYANDNLLGGK